MVLPIVYGEFREMGSAFFLREIDDPTFIFPMETATYIMIGGKKFRDPQIYITNHSDHKKYIHLRLDFFIRPRRNLPFSLVSFLSFFSCFL